MSRLASEFWVKAYLKTLSLRGISAFVVARGDVQAGAILIKLSPLDGTSTLYQKGFDLDTGTQSWIVLVQGDESEVDLMISRQRSFDPDLWVLEVENPLNDAHLIDP
jgi:hypothetical protein